MTVTDDQLEIDLTSPLTEEEAAQLQDCIYNFNLHKTEQVKALKQIHDLKLYREHGTFEQFATNVLGISVRKAHYMVDYGTILEICTTVQIEPPNEAQARELADIEDPAEVVAVIEQTRSDAKDENKPVTAAAVKATKGKRGSATRKRSSRSSRASASAAKPKNSRLLSKIAKFMQIQEQLLSTQESRNAIAQIIANDGQQLIDFDVVASNLNDVLVLANRLRSGSDVSEEVAAEATAIERLRGQVSNGVAAIEKTLKESPAFASV
jgi:hypothetical protein